MRWLVFLVAAGLAGCLGGASPDEAPGPPTSRDAQEIPDTPGGPNQTRVGQDTTAWEARPAAGPGASGTCAPGVDGVSLHTFAWTPKAPADAPAGTLLTRIEAWTNMTVRGAVDSVATARLLDPDGRLLDDQTLAIFGYGVGGVSLSDRVVSTFSQGLPIGGYTVEVEFCPSTPVFLSVEAKAHYYVDS